MFSVRPTSGICLAHLRRIIPRRRWGTRVWDLLGAVKEDGGGGGDGGGEAVGFVADLEVFEPSSRGDRTEGFMDEDGFVGGECGDVGAEVDAVETGPSGGVEEGAKVMDGEGFDGVGEIGIGVAELVLALDAGRSDGSGGGLPEAVVGGVAAEAKDAVGGEGSELGDEAGVGGGEEGGVGELLGLVGEADEVFGDAGAGLAGEELEGGGGWGGLGEEFEAGESGGGGGESEETAAIHESSGGLHGEKGTRVARAVATMGRMVWDDGHGREDPGASSQVMRVTRTGAVRHILRFRNVAMVLA